MILGACVLNGLGIRPQTPYFGGSGSSPLGPFVTSDPIGRATRRRRKSEHLRKPGGVLASPPWFAWPAISGRGWHCQPGGEKCLRGARASVPMGRRKAPCVWRTPHQTSTEADPFCRLNSCISLPPRMARSQAPEGCSLLDRGRPRSAVRKETGNVCHDLSAGSHSLVMTTGR
jgi:hypothetical protein